MHRMRHVLYAFVLSVLVPLAACGQAQGPATGPLLTDDLCGCMSAIDLKKDDRSVNFAVRHCLEDAVVHHPGEVLGLLDRYPERGSKAYLLGLILGGALEGSCAPFHAVKVRLQQMPGQGSLKKPGT